MLQQTKNLKSFYQEYKMPNQYRPEEPRPGTEEKTNMDNIRQIFAILNRMGDKIDKLESIVNNLIINIGGGTGTGDDEDKEFALMVGLE